MRLHIATALLLVLSCFARPEHKRHRTLRLRGAADKNQDECSEELLAQYAEEFPDFVAFQKKYCTCAEKAATIKDDDEREMAEMKCMESAYEGAPTCYDTPVQETDASGATVINKKLECMSGRHTISGQKFTSAYSGIEAMGTDLVVKDCTFDSLTETALTIEDLAPYDGENYVVLSTGNLGVSDCTFKNCYADNIITVFAKSTIRYCTFEGCANSEGIISFSTPYACSISNCQFTKCVSTHQWGSAPCITAELSAKLTVTHCTFTECKAVNNPVIISVTFSIPPEDARANTASPGALDLSNCAFFKNELSDSGTEVQEVQVSTASGVTIGEKALTITDCYTDQDPATSFSVPEGQSVEGVKKTEKTKLEDVITESGADEDAGIQLSNKTDDDDDDDGFPMWAIVVIVVGAVVIIAAVVCVILIYMFKCRKAKVDASDKTFGDAEQQESSSNTTETTPTTQEEEN